MGNKQRDMIDDFLRVMLDISESLRIKGEKRLAVQLLHMGSLIAQLLSEKGDKYGRV